MFLSVDAGERKKWRRKKSHNKTTTKATNQDMTKFRVTSADFTKQTHKQKEKKIDRSKQEEGFDGLPTLTLTWRATKYNLQTK